MVRFLLITLAVLGALVAAGYWLIPLMIVHAPALVGGFGVLLLIVGLSLRRKPTCAGLHCPSCTTNH